MLRPRALFLFGFAGVAALVALATTFGGASAGSGVALLVVLVLQMRQHRHLTRLRAWLRDPEGSPAPEAEGPWKEVVAELRRFRRMETNSRQRVAAALERFVEAAQAMPDAVILLDSADRIGWCNGAATQQFGITMPRDRQQPVTNLIRYPAFADYLAGPGGEPVVVRSARGPQAVLAVQVIPFGDDEKLIVSRDITSMQTADTIRRDFIANVSHELRTPLTVVNGFLELLGDGMLDPRQASHQIRLMREQTARMTRLVEDLLTLSRLEAGDAPPAAEVVNVSALVESLLEEARSLSGGRHVISAHADPATLMGASDELRTAFSNLVSNAIRYTPAGGRVHIEWLADAERGEFAGTDTGIGVAPEHIPRLTERFYRVDRGRSRATGGTGLGLAIVKHVLLRHDAHIEVESEPGAGSRFSCRFPLERLLTAGSGATAQEGVT